MLANLFRSAFLAFLMLMSQMPLNAIAEELQTLQGESAQTQTETVTPQVQTTPTEPEEEDPAGSIVDNVPVGDKHYLDNGLVLQVNADSKTLTVVDFIAPSASVTIPDRYPNSELGMPVTRIADLAFKDKVNLSTVILSDNIEYIGDDVFSGCTSLKFNVHDNVNYLGTDSNDYFYLVSVNADQNTYDIRSEVKIVASYAFHNCNNLTEIVIPESVIQVGFRALRGCDNLQSVTLPFAGEVEQGDTNNHVGFAFGARTYGGNISFIPETLTSLVIKRGKLQKNALYGLDTVEHLGLPSMQQPLAYYYGGETYEDNIKYVPAKLRSVTVAYGNIHEYAFYNCINIEDIRLGDDVVSVGKAEKVFYRTKYYNNESNWIDGVWYCGNNIIKVKTTKTGEFIVGENIRAIAAGAFSSCKQLTSIDIPFGVTSIGDGTFSWCSSLTSIELPDSVTSIGENAFYDCSSLTSIEIPDSVTSIGDYAFAECSKLTSVGCGENSQLTSIGEYAFRGCSSLTNIEIPDSVTSIDAYAFRDCRSLTSIEIPSGVTSIGNYAFGNCSSLTSIKIPDSVTSIGNHAFYNCSNLTSVTFGENSQLTSIGDYAFLWCSSLTSIYYGGTYAQWNAVSRGSSWNSNTGTYVIYCSDSTVKKDGTVTYFDENTRALTKLAVQYAPVLPNILLQEETAPRTATATEYYSEGLEYASNGDGTCTVIGIGTCTDVEIIIPDESPTGDRVTSIYQYAFEYNKTLTSIVIPNSVTVIGDYAFDGCSSLINILIPDSVIRVGYCAFGGTAYYDDLTNWENNVLYIGKHLIEAKPTVSGYYQIISGTLTIGKWAFNNCSGLTGIAIPDSVINIGQGAFSGTSYYNQTSNWQNGVLYNGKHLIEAKGTVSGNCTIKMGTLTIAENAFSSCRNLTSITIPASVTNIGAGAFLNCSSLTEVYSADVAAWCTIRFNNYSANPMYYAKKLYFNNTLAKDVVIPVDVTHISPYVFYNCSSLTSIEIPSGVTNISDHAFNSCSSLTSVTFGENSQLSSIGYSAFRGCSSLTSIVLPIQALTASGTVGYKFSFQQILTPWTTIVDIIHGPTAKNDCVFHSHWDTVRHH